MGLTEEKCRVSIDLGGISTRLKKNLKEDVCRIVTEKQDT
jgi:hypothetical protein